MRLTRDPVSRRAFCLLAVYLVVFGGITHRLVHVQVRHADHYAETGMRQRARTVELPAQRGRLYDRDGNVLATSIEAATVYADPRAFRPQERDDGLVVAAAGDPAAVAAALAPLIGRGEEWIVAQLQRDAHFVYLGRQLDHEVGRAVRDLRLPGIGVLAEPRRVYPLGRLAAQVIGFTGIDGDGLAGLELQHDGLLKGRPGTLVLERAPGGLAIPSGGRELTPPAPGTDLVLTIDREVQHVAEQAAAAAVERFGALAASVAVLEVGTGEVLAMASVPTYDLGDIGASPQEARRNRAITDMFEPGSVQKALTAAAAIEEGVATTDLLVEVPDHLRFGRWTISDVHRRGTTQMTFREVIESSSNVGTVLVAQELGEERLGHYLDAFGLGRPLGVGFPGEAAGSFPTPGTWSATSLPTIAIGQGIAVTLLQAAQVYATIAGGGMATQPRLVRGTVGPDGRLTPAPPPAQRRVVSESTAAAVTEILAGVVAGGTGSQAAVSGYGAAGKTGTARKPSLDERGYSGEYVAAFVGFAPIDAPRFVVAVMVDEPTPIWGGVVAAPLFAEIMEFVLTHRRVPPTQARAAGDLPPEARGAAGWERPVV